MNIPSFIRWPGGKKRLLVQIGNCFPEKIDRYFEPFLGGGSMFFYIKQKYDPKECILSDINEDLIDAFKAVRDHPLQLIKLLEYFRKNNSKEFYYGTRELFNKRKINGLKRSAAFIYFTKTCFNGVYRVNSKGEYNVPYGLQDGKKIYKKEEILYASKLLKGAVLKKQDYKEILPLINKGDLVYLDPCYDPIKRTSFVHYTPDRFAAEDRYKLFAFINSLRDKKAKIILSNNNIKQVENLYKNANYHVNFVEAARCVNVNPQGRGRIKELLITSI